MVLPLGVRMPVCEWPSFLISLFSAFGEFPGIAFVCVCLYTAFICVSALCVCLCHS